MKYYMNKLEIIKKHRISENDTGSSQVQIALLTEDIASLTVHFQKNKKDHHSKRGFLKKLETRRKLLKYLKRTNTQQYSSLIEALGLRK
ncbi:30S ribosomal protein S15 [Alphaproteobacteria bacterium endosymbiont of Tiliacea citrago]|uniref:30S ribosomal protein S15 n=1 Tax=Alphaproteobacteria bacterium endosymbiont of Tiliacea citrago TaxID=3077944 RepID=UPI00313EB4A1